MIAEPAGAPGDLPDSGESFGARASGLPKSERALYRRILERFIDRGQPPLDPLPGVELAPLIDLDLVQVDDEDRLAVAYPFSTRPTRHRVALREGRDYFAMCAIDALGIPYMLDERAEIHAQEPDGGEIVRVTVDPDGELTWTPALAVALAAFGDGSCLAQSACPHFNLFSSPDGASRYLDIHRLQGSILTINEAAAAGRWLFGDLLADLADPEVC